MSDAIAALPIAAVERDTGLSKDVLRVWERRYGFPTPTRDAGGDRLYPLNQVERLHLIKQLLGRGYRPNKVVPLPPDELHALISQHTGKGAHPAAAEIITLLLGDDPSAVGSYLRQRLGSEGLRHFVLETLADANEDVGEAWRLGEIAVHQEHQYTEQVQAVLRTALASLPPGSARPRVILTTLPGELHTLGLLMVESLLRLEGVQVLSYGPQLSLNEIVAAAEQRRADVVALSFSAGAPSAGTLDLIKGLRQQLPTEVEIWVGGRGSPGPKRLQDLARNPKLDRLPDAVAAWRDRHPTPYGG